MLHWLPGRVGPQRARQVQAERHESSFVKFAGVNGEDWIASFFNRSRPRTRPRPSTPSGLGQCIAGGCFVHRFLPVQAAFNRQRSEIEDEFEFEDDKKNKGRAGAHPSQLQEGIGFV
jgi:hypothetical protein